MFLAICLGALMTNIILKDLIARPRPFETMQVYFTWWEAAGAVPEDGFSFPSGHATAVSAGMISLALTQRNVRTFLIALTTMLLMGLARVYLFAHYPTDVLAGFLVGMLAAYIAFVLTHHIFVTRNPMIAAPKNPAGTSKRGR